MLMKLIKALMLARKFAKMDVESIRKIIIKVRRLPLRPVGCLAQVVL